MRVDVQRILEPSALLVKEQRAEQTRFSPFKMDSRLRGNDGLRLISW